MLPHQIELSEKLSYILENNHGFITSSPVGSGKTYVTLWLAKKFGFSLVVICPVTIKHIWEQLAQKFGVHIVFIMSYESLAGNETHGIKHNYLTRTESTYKGKSNPIFEATEDFLKIVDKGVLMVFDEYQKIKNPNTYYKACNALLKPILYPDEHISGLSRFALLSGTPYDKITHAIYNLKILGYIQSPKLYRKIGGIVSYKKYGLGELITLCKQINRTLTKQLIAQYGITVDSIETLVYKLYSNIVKYNISASMTSEKNPMITNDIANGFFKITRPENLAAIEYSMGVIIERVLPKLKKNIEEFGNKTMLQLLKISENRHIPEIDDENIEEPLDLLSLMNFHLKRIEFNKAYDYTRIAKYILDMNKNNKVIISINYKDTISEVSEILAEYRPLVLDGSVKESDRAEIIRKFNEDSQYRVLVMSTKTGGVGISLHDIVGNFPRFMILGPSYNFIDITQAAGRIVRTGQASDSWIRIFYTKDSPELNLLTALANKSDVLKGAIDDNVSESILLIGDYPTFIEEDDGPVGLATLPPQR